MLEKAAQITNPISYTEFIVANMNLKTELSQKNMCLAFNALDRDGNGRIGSKDFLFFLSEKSIVNERDLTLIIEEAGGGKHL